MKKKKKIAAIKRCQTNGKYKEQKFKGKKEEVLPGIEPGSLESESKVITITLQNQ